MLKQIKYFHSLRYNIIDQNILADVYFMMIH